MKLMALMTLMAGLCCFDVAADEAAVAPAKSRVDVYYPHNTFRCMSCNTIENLLKAAVFGGKGANLKNGTEIEVKPIYKALVEKGKITFKSLNVDEKENAGFLKKYKSEAKIPVLVAVKDGKEVKVKVLDAVWKLLGDNGKFVEYVRKNLNEMLELIK